MTYCPGLDGLASVLGATCSSAGSPLRALSAGSPLMSFVRLCRQAKHYEHTTGPVVEVERLCIRRTAGAMFVASKSTSPPAFASTLLGTLLVYGRAENTSHQPLYRRRDCRTLRDCSSSSDLG
eukprot:TRINITY_DN13575_c0_g1_i2.p8 TRINITY_DN13575_c0_g1~~TRINITY_DN13575_c0_g1_i2.p8  ORF type:complete len:123 (+),score=19.09 TRINITY_DN13575_c0_g1_i2:3017-3385(+)